MTDLEKEYEQRVQKRKEEREALKNARSKLTELKLPKDANGSVNVDFLFGTLHGSVNDTWFKRMIAEGHLVISLDDLSRTYLESLKKKHPLTESDVYQALKSFDKFDREYVRLYCKRYGFDYDKISTYLLFS